MTQLRQILSDTRQRTLLLIAAVLLAGIVAVPTLLAKPAPKQTAVAQLPQTAPATAPRATALPAVSVTGTPSHNRLTGRARDPFLQGKVGGGSSLSPTTQTVTATGAGTSGSKAGAGSSSTAGTSTTGGAGTSTTSTTPSTTTTSTTPTTTTPGGSGSKPSPPPGLNAKEAYDVVLALTNSSGGFDTLDRFERLGVLPSSHQPLLVELGVLKGGHRVLFAVQPGAFVSGPGSCTPEPLDCEILSLAPGQLETISVPSASGPVPVAMFSVTAIKVAHFHSAAAASKARRRESATGRRVLRSSSLSTLSLFQYKASAGAVVDLRNLTVVGGI